MAVAENALLPTYEMPSARKQMLRSIESAFDRQAVFRVTSPEASSPAIVLAEEMLREILRPYRVQVDWLPEDNGRITLWVNTLETGVTGNDPEDAVKKLLADVRSYVRNYHEDWGYYRRFANTRKRFPYVLRLALARDDADLERLLFRPKDS